MQERIYKIGFLTGVMLMLASSPAHSLGMNYTLIMVENFQIGQTTSMVQAANLPLEVTNNHKFPITVSLEVFQPQPGEIKPGFEPIPSAAWLDIGPLETEIEPGQVYKTDVRITIPDDPAYLGKKYAVYIQSSVIGSREKKVPLVIMSITGKLLFSIAPEKADLIQSEPAAGKKDKNLSFTLLPSRVDLDNIPLGEKVSVLTADKVPVRIDNPNTESLTFTVSNIKPQDTVLAIRDGYEPTPDPEFILLPSEPLKIKAKSTRPLQLFVNIPDQPEYRGKKYFFVVSVLTGKKAVERGQYLRIFVSTAAAH